MTENLLIIWILTAVVFLLDVLFIAVKSSLSFTRLPYLLNLRESRENAVDRTVEIIELPRLRTSLRIAVMLTHFLLAGLLLYILRAGWPQMTLLPVFLFLFLGLLLLTCVEFGIEGLVLKSPEESAVRLRFFGVLINFFFSPLSAMMMGLLGPNANKMRMASMTEEDLKNWVEVGQPEGSLEKGEREMIYSIFQFGDTLAKEIMIPRIEVLALDINTTLGEARETFIRAGHSRVPVYEDTVDNIVGLLYAKDLLGIRKDQDLIVDHRDMIRLAYFVPEAKKVDELLAEMQSRSMHMAIVVDEYGGVAGVVTLEDIVEEIIGEIRDEYDQSEELPYTQVGPNEFVFLGRVDLDIFNDVMHADIETGNADTIGGFIYGEIGDVPNGGERIELDDLVLVVEEVIGRRISKVRAKNNHPGEREEEKDNAD